MNELDEKIQKLEPLKCPGCSSIKVTKEKNHIHCDDCGYDHDLKKGTKKKKKVTPRAGKGHNPRYDMGDYLE